MQKTIIAAAVAGLLAMPAFAQSRVVLSGKINAAWEWSQAKGATRGPSNNIKMRDRMIESGSEFHIKAYEDLGNGNQAFVDIQTAVDIFNSNDVATPDSGRLASRRAAVGLSGNWGTLQLGKWDIHYNAQIWGGTGPNAALNQQYGAVSLLNQVGGRSYATMGCRCDNTIRYVTPNFNGFEFGIAYTRNGSTATGEQTWRPGDQNKVDRAFGAQINYKNAGLALMVAYWYRQNAQGEIGLAGGATRDPVTGVVNYSNSHRDWANSDYYKGLGNGVLRDEQSIRAGIAYTFDMGLTIGANFDRSETKHKFLGANNNLAGDKVKLRRNAWVFPLYYKTGPHQFNLAYGFADDIKNWDDTGTQYWTANYGYALSKRTTLYAGYAQYKNDRYATYDFWSNTALGLTHTKMGADPVAFAIGMIHTF